MAAFLRVMWEFHAGVLQEYQILCLHNWPEH